MRICTHQSALVLADRREQMSATNYFVVPAPGHYGDTCTVLSSHASLASAKRNASKGYAVRRGTMAKGDRFVRADEQHHPVVR
jgi:hypothetical protein